MKKTFVMAAAIMFSIATMAQTGTRRATKNKLQTDSLKNMSKDSLYMGSDTASSSNGKYRSNKKSKMNKSNKMKSKSKMTRDSTSTS